MTNNARPSADDISDMLCARNQELEHEKAVLLEENDRLRAELDEARRQLAMRGE